MHNIINTVTYTLYSTAKTIPLDTLIRKKFQQCLAQRGGLKGKSRAGSALGWRTISERWILPDVLSFVWRADVVVWSNRDGHVRKPRLIPRSGRRRVVRYKGIHKPASRHPGQGRRRTGQPAGGQASQQADRQGGRHPGQRTVRSGASSIEQREETAIGDQIASLLAKTRQGHNVLWA